MPNDFHIASHRRYVMPFHVSGTLATGDDQFVGTIPFRLGKLVGGVMSVLTIGDTGGNTTITVEKNVDASASDMLSTAQSVAYNASDYSTAWGPEAINADGSQEVQQGDQVNINIDAIPTGTSSTELSGCLIFQIIEE